MILTRCLTTPPSTYTLWLTVTPVLFIKPLTVVLPGPLQTRLILDITNVY